MLLSLALRSSSQTARTITRVAHFTTTHLPFDYYNPQSHRGTYSDRLDDRISRMERRAEMDMGKQRQQQKKERLRGREKEPLDVRMSKTLSWLLRHGASSEGLHMRQDGYVRVKDLLALPKMRTLDFMALERLVQEDNKMRYHLLFEPDVSANESASGAEVWWIRANQGHSMKSVKLNLTEITDRGQVPMAVHGTTLKAWASISQQGLSKMNRNHIHLAQGVAGDGVISGMRTSSQVLIYVDLDKALKAGLKFHLSDNGVVLTEGNAEGFLPPEFFRRVERANRQPIPGWEGPEGGVLIGERQVTAGIPDEVPSPPSETKA